MKNKKKKVKNYVSKSNLANFFLFYGEKYSELKRFYYFNFSFLGVLFLYSMLYYTIGFFMIDLIIFLVFILSLVVLGSRKMIHLRQIDNETIDEFVSFFETLGEKRKKSFKFLIEKLEIAQKKFTNHDKFMIILYILSIVILLFIIPTLIILILEPVQSLINPQLNFSLQLLMLLIKIGMIVIIFITQNRKLDYKSVERCSDLFKNYINIKLSNFEDIIEKIIQTKSNKLSFKELDLIMHLKVWYDFYCSRFSESEELNKIFKLFEELVFDIEEEDFFFEIFSNLKGRIVDYRFFIFQNLEEENEELKYVNETLDILDNYLIILEKNLNIKRQRKNEGRERRKNLQTVIYMIITPITLTLSIISIVISI